MRFADRAEAGKALARRLAGFECPAPVVLALPRGGVVVGAEIATALQARMQVVPVRKIGHPGNPEYAIGAIAEGVPAIYNPLERAQIDPMVLAGIEAREMREIDRRAAAYGISRDASIDGSTAIVVDDGIATGLTMLAAIAWVRSRCPARVVVAVPVAPRDAAVALGAEVDEFVAVIVPEPFEGATGMYYKDFRAISDEDVLRALRLANGR